MRHVLCCLFIAVPERSPLIRYKALGVPLALAEQRTVSRQVCLRTTLASGCLVALLAFSGGLAVGEVFGLVASRALGGRHGLHSRS